MTADTARTHHNISDTNGSSKHSVAMREVGGGQYTINRHALKCPRVSGAPASSHTFLHCSVLLHLRGQRATGSPKSDHRDASRLRLQCSTHHCKTATASHTTTAITSSSVSPVGRSSLRSEMAPDTPQRGPERHEDLEWTRWESPLTPVRENPQSQGVVNSTKFQLVHVVWTWPGRNFRTFDESLPM